MYVISVKSIKLECGDGLGEKGKKRKRKRGGKTRWFLGRLKTALKIFVAIILLCIVVVGGWFYKEYGSTILKMKSEAAKLVADADSTTFSRNRASTVYDIDENVINVFTTDGNTGYLSYDDIPKYAVDAVVATEDRSFFEHDGVDIKANVKAVYELIKHEGEVTRGASTITQQLAKNIFLTNEVTWQRKTEEIFIALNLEKKYDKNEILEFYINNIYYANGYYGIEAASQGYFSVSAKELDLAQIAFISAIPNGPTRYDPLVHMDNTLERKDRILSQMCDLGYISTEDYNLAKDEEIVLNVRTADNKKVSDYVVSYVNYCGVRAVMESEGFEFKDSFESEEEREEYEKKFEEFYDVCQRYIYSKGYNIYTSIDVKKQRLLQKAVNEQMKSFKEKKDDGIYNMQAAAVCIDNNTGKVVAIVGGRSQKQAAFGLNRAYQSYRQPGSCIKPLLIYSTAFENGYTPDSEVVDEKREDGPENASGNYLGKTDIRTAIEQSINTVAWNFFEKLKPYNCLTQLVDMGFKKITYEDDYMAASLGGFKDGASPLEMAAAYAAVENDGIFTVPTCILRVEDVYGRELISYEGGTSKQGAVAGSKKVVFEKNAARMLTDCMEGVLTRGTAAGYALKGMSCAGKTGTTNDRKDGWFAGYTPYYTTAVWVGGDNPVKVDDLSGATYPLYIWNQYMSEIHKGLKNKDFEDYKIVVE